MKKQKLNTNSSSSLQTQIDWLKIEKKIFFCTSHNFHKKKQKLKLKRDFYYFMPFKF